MLTEPDNELCPICQQTENNCIYFRQLHFELLCFKFWLFLFNQMRQSRANTLSAEYLTQLLPLLQILKVMQYETSPIPEYYHFDHVPAHWLQEPESRSGENQRPPEQIDLGLAWQLQLNRHPENTASISSSLLRASQQIHLAHQLGPRRPSTPIRAQPAANPIAQAVSQHFPAVAPNYTPSLCSITLKVPKQPGRVVPCGHTFSFKAIHEWASHHPPGEAPCPNCRGNIKKIEQICLPLPIDHRRLHDSVYLLWLSRLPKAKPLPISPPQELEITRWLLRHSLLFANPGAQELMRHRSIP